jgi:hypothetical protein
MDLEFANDLIGSDGKNAAEPEGKLGTRALARAVANGPDFAAGTAQSVTAAKQRGGKRRGR